MEIIFLNQGDTPFNGRKYTITLTGSHIQLVRFAFFKSYFSNYIEGTVFELDEAKQIIETQTPLPTRNEDSHDVLGTYRIVPNKKEMKINPSTPEELITILKYRHKILMSARADKKPGEFKDKNNRVGQTSFADLNLLNGIM